MKELSEVSLISKSLSDSNQLQVIHLLTDGEPRAYELLEQLQIAQPTLTHYMKRLKDYGLVL